LIWMTRNSGPATQKDYPGLAEPEFPGDEHPLHLRGSLADLEHLGVAVETAHRRLVHEAVAAEYLGGGPGVVHRGVRGGQLGDRGLFLDRLDRPQPRRGVIPGQPGRMNPRLHVGHGELDRLVLADGTAERLA